MVPQAAACRLLGLSEFFAVPGDAAEMVEISASFWTEALSVACRAVKSYSGAEWSA
jgi:hypothetical protein